MNTWTIIIIGATGDLAMRRLIPTLYTLLKHDKHVSFTFIGAAKEIQTSDELIKKSIMMSIKHPEQEIIDRLCKNSSYVAIDFSDPESFKQLAKEVNRVEQDHGLSGNRLIYLAVASSWYSIVTELLVTSGVIINQKKTRALHHIVYEKPFGWDASSALQLNDSINSQLEEEQIYRVDHYTSKSLVSSLLLTRFSNALFEPTWNADSIEQVHITLIEKDTLDDRGAFYDRYGALKDVVQNHILQLLAFTAMDRPISFNPEIMSATKSALLGRVRFTDGLLGQYDGYTNVIGVAPNSQRETFALLRAEISTPRWKNVPFFIKTGKALDHKSTEIQIVFKAESKKILNSTGSFEHNRIIIRISPDSAIIVRFNMQRGHERMMVPLSLEVCYRCTFGAEQPHSYETLFREIMDSDKTTAVSLDEIVSAWNCIEQIENLSLPLYRYRPGTAGPAEVQEFTQKYAVLWDTGAKRAR